MSSVGQMSTLLHCFCCSNQLSVLNFKQIKTKKHVFGRYLICNWFFLQNNADLMFGGITIICGIFGTLAGGFALDRMTNTISNAFKVDSFHSKGFLVISKSHKTAFRSNVRELDHSSCICIYSNDQPSLV